MLVLLAYFFHLDKKPVNNKTLLPEQQILQNLSLEEKIGQLFMVRCPENQQLEIIQKYNLGGYILFARDFKDKTRDQVIATINAYQDSSKIPMFIGVDEEGGSVVRVSQYKNLRNQAFLGPQELYSQGGFSLIYQDTVEKARFLKDLGINLNFAPVADVSTSSNDFIYKRTIGQNQEVTQKYVETVVRAMNEEKMGSVLKHFPGYGNNLDTHLSSVIDKRDYKTFENSDFLPFKTGIENNASMILVSHNIVLAMDPLYPASLSLKIHNILRDQLGFNGVIITDDLAMGAIKSWQNDENLAVLAIEAGNDIILTSSYEKEIAAIKNAVLKGEITEERINESVLRILKLKLKLGIIE